MHPPADYHCMKAELYSMGNNMNPIAKVANAKVRIDVKAFAKALRWLWEVILEIEKALHARHVAPDGKAGTLSANSIKKIHMMFKTALKRAVNNGLLIRNPANNVILPKVRPREMWVLSLDEQNKIEHAALENDNRNAFGVYLCENPLWALAARPQGGEY